MSGPRQHLGCVVQSAFQALPMGSDLLMRAPYPFLLGDHYTPLPFCGHLLFLEGVHERCSWGGLSNKELVLVGQRVPTSIARAPRGFIEAIAIYSFERPHWNPN